MPNKHNEDRRHHIAKKSMEVTNWAEYNAGLRRRGSLTLWITEEAMAAWQAPARLTRGDQAHYSDSAIKTNLLLRAAFRMALRQAQGLMASGFELTGVGLTVGWQEAAGYGKRSLVETAMGRYKGIIGARLRSRSWPAQQCEAAIGVAVLNRMTEAGRPRSARTGGAYA